jgi:DNA-binding CsgD family transcriptional regulator
MSEQWSLLVMVIAVAAGLVGAVAAAMLVRSRHTAFFRYFLMQTLLFNLLILTGLVFEYVNLEIHQRGLHPHPALQLGLLAVLTALKLAWVYAFLAMTLVVTTEELAIRFRKGFLFGAVGIFGAWIVLQVIPGAMGAATRFTELTDLGVIGGAVAGCVALMVRANALPLGRRRRSIYIISGIYCTIFAVMIVSLLAAWLGKGSIPNRLLFNGTFMVLYNLVPLAWVVRIEPVGPLAGAEVVEHFRITAREREIVDLICGGFTNQEIADRLFISLATVKDHNSNIFRKTGVRNRVELLNLMRGEGQVRLDRDE